MFVNYELLSSILRSPNDRYNIFILTALFAVLLSVDLSSDLVMKNDQGDGNCEGESFLDEFEIGKIFELAITRVYVLLSVANVFICRFRIMSSATRRRTTK